MLRPDERHVLDGWFAANLPRIRAFVERRLGGRLRRFETPDDIVQSTCREVVAAMVRSGDGAGPGRRWRFCRQVLCKIVDKHRYHAARKRMPCSTVLSGSGLERVVDTGGEPLSTVIAAERARRLSAALATLPAHYRQVIVWAHVDGLPHAEIGRRLARGEAASKMLLMRAMVKLGEALGKE